MIPINILKQSAFSGNWIKADVAGFSQALKQFAPNLTVLRAWQEECAVTLIDAQKPNRLIVAPTGSGKSIAINYLISHMLHNKMAWKRGGWDLYPKSYYYPGTGKNARTIMLSVIFSLKRGD